MDGGHGPVREGADRVNVKEESVSLNDGTRRLLLKLRAGSKFEGVQGKILGSEVY